MGEQDSTSPTNRVPDWARGPYFTSPDGESVQARFHARWQIENNLPYPRLGWMRCPMCSSKDIRLRYWKFHQNHDPSKKYPYRCDIGWKCQVCAMVWIHGVATPKEVNEYWGYKVEITDKEALAGVEPNHDTTKWDGLRSRVLEQE